MPLSKRSLYLLVALPVLTSQYGHATILEGILAFANILWLRYRSRA
jgi:hypothetical protein